MGFTAAIPLAEAVVGTLGLAKGASMLANSVMPKMPSVPPAPPPIPAATPATLADASKAVSGDSASAAKKRGVGGMLETSAGTVGNLGIQGSTTANPRTANVTLLGVSK